MFFKLLLLLMSFGLLSTLGMSLRAMQEDIAQTPGYFTFTDTEEQPSQLGICSNSSYTGSETGPEEVRICAGTLEPLPYELIIYVFGYLPECNFWAMVATCIRFYRAAIELFKSNEVNIGTVLPAFTFLLPLAPSGLPEDDVGVRMAVENDWMVLIRLIIELRYDGDSSKCFVNQSDWKNALHLAAERGHTQLVEMLIKLDKSPQTSRKKDFYVDARWQRSERYYALVSSAPLKDRDKHGDTPLHLAAQNGHLDPVRVFIDNRFNLDRENFAGETALYQAVVRGHEDVVKVLFEANADPIKSGPCYVSPSIPIIGAIEGNWPNIVEILKETINATLQGRRNPCDVEARVVGGYRGKALSATIGQTPLHMMAAYDNSTTIPEALDDRDKIRLKDDSGSRDKIIQSLLALKADVNAADSDGRTPFLRCIFRGADGLSTAQLLIKNGAHVKHQDNSGKTALHLCIEAGGFGRTHSKELLEFLFKAGVDCQAKDGDGNTALHCAASGCSSDLVECLLAEKAAVNAINNNGETPLHRAVRFYRRANFGEVAKVVGLLEQAGADQHARDNLG